MTVAVPNSPPAAVDASSSTRRNWWLHVLEGASLIGASAAINPSTVGNSLVESLGGAPWMVALMPMATHMGFSLGPILTAHRLDRRSEFLPVLRDYLPWARVPLLLTAGVLWLAGAGAASLWAVVGGALAYGVIGGLSIGAWQQLVAKTILPTERASLFANRYLLSNVVGLGVGALVAYVLTHFPGTDGYAALYFFAFLGAALSYRLMTSIDEPGGARASLEARSFLENVRDVPRLFSGDRRLRLYLLTAVLVNSQFIFIGFLAIHARVTLRASESYVGTLTTAQMAGAVFGTFLAARLGSRLGSGTLLLWSRLAFLLVALGSLVAAHDYAFQLLFAVYGAALWVNLVGHNTMTLELLPSNYRATVLATFSLVQVPSMLLASQMGALVWQLGWGFPWVAGVSALGLLGAVVSMWTLGRTAPPPAATSAELPVRHRTDSERSYRATTMGSDRAQAHRP